MRTESPRPNRGFTSETITRLCFRQELGLKKRTENGASENGENGASHLLWHATSVSQIAIYDDLCRPTPRVWMLLRAATVTERGGSTAMTNGVCFAAQMELRPPQVAFPDVHPWLKTIPMPGRSGRIPDLKPAVASRLNGRGGPKVR